MEETMKVKTKTFLFPVLTVGFILALGFSACSNDKDAKGNEEAKDCTITFELGFTTSRTPPEPITVKKGASAGSDFPVNPSRTIWDFTGWKDSSGEVYDGNTIINDDVTLTASWYFPPGPSNPFITDRFTADPAAFVDGKTVYLVCGEDTLPPDDNSDFRIKQWLIYSTTDMKTFNFENVLMKSDDFTYGNPNTAWASQAIKGLDGRYYFYGTVVHKTMGTEAISVASSDYPTGPWKQAGTTALVTSTMANQDTPQFQGINIDPTVFIDDDETAWVCWSQTTPRIAKLEDSMIKIERPIKYLFPTSWKSEHRYTEGPFLYKRGKVYYLFYASMSTGAETISYSMARDTEGVGLAGLIGQEGVWSDGVPITGFAPGPDGRGNSYTIHPAILDFKGQTYLFYHSAALSITQEDGSVWEGTTGRRCLCVDYLYFNEDGTVKLFDNPDPNGRPAKIAVDVRNPAGLSVPPKDK